MAHTNLPTRPRRFRSRARPSPFDFSLIQGAPHDMPEKYFDKLPKFSGSSAKSIEEHIESVWNYMDVYGAEAEDVYMVALKTSLEGDARCYLPN